LLILDRWLLTKAKESGFIFIVVDNQKSAINNSYLRAYGIGSSAPASSNARNRSTQLSHTPQAASSRL
jgi:hypothetical protein